MLWFGATYIRSLTVVIALFTEARCCTIMPKQKLYWSGDVVILMKFSSLAAPRVVILTTFSAAATKISSKLRNFYFNIILGLKRQITTQYIAKVASYGWSLLSLTSRKMVAKNKRPHYHFKSFSMGTRLIATILGGIKKCICFMRHSYSCM